MSASTHADAVGLAAHDIPCTNLADSSATTIAELAQGKLAVLGAAQPPARPRRCQLSGISAWNCYRHPLRRPKALASQPPDLLRSGSRPR